MIHSLFIINSSGYINLINKYDMINFIKIKKQNLVPYFFFIFFFVEMFSWKNIGAVLSQDRFVIIF